MTCAPARHALAWTLAHAATLAVVCVPPVLAQGTAGPPRPVFRTAVDLVIVEATAVDGRGDVVKDLRAADFRAEIGKRAREVVSAEFVEYSASAPAPVSVQADVTVNADPTLQRTVLVIVDQTSLEFESRSVLNGAARWLATLGASDRVGFLALPPPGPVVEFTTDHASIAAAFTRLGTGVGRSTTPYTGRNVGLWEAFQILEHNDLVQAQVVARECRPRDPTCLGQILDNARVLVEESQMRVVPVLSSIHAVLTELQSTPGPKHVVLVTAGWPLEERDATSRMATLAEAAALANVTVHVVTAEQWTTAASLMQVSPSRVMDRQMTLASVETLAGFTGGRSVRVTGMGDAAFKSLTSGISGHYRLAVRPEPDDLDGRSRRIDLDVTRRGVSLMGYRRVLAGARPPPPQASANAPAAARNAIRSAESLTDIGLKATSYARPGDSGAGLVRVTVVTEVTRAAAGPATVLAVLIDADGRPANGAEEDLPIDSSRQGRVITELTVSPGHYVLHLAVADAEGRTGSIERAIDATWHDAGGASTTTGLVLLRAPGRTGATDAPEPLLDVLPPGDSLIVQLPLSAPLVDRDAVTYALVSSEGAVGIPATLGTTSGGALVVEGTVPANTLRAGRYTVVATVGPGTRFERSFTVATLQP